MQGADPIQATPGAGEPCARRRLPLALGLTALAVALAAASLLGPGERAAAANGAPNIIVVMTDDQDFRSMWAMKKTRTRLAGHGITFRNSFATNPVCCPSRATFLTGQYSHNHGVLTNAPPDGGLGKFHPLEDRTIAVALEDAGYTTAFVGKYLNGYPSVAAEDPQFRPPGWSRWLAMSRMGLYNWVLNRNGSEKTFGSLKRHYNTDVLARLSKRFIANVSGGKDPFFLTVMTMAPHGERERRFAEINPRPARRHSNKFPKLKLRKLPSFNRQAVGKPDYLHRPPFTKQIRKRLRAKHQGRMRSLVAVDDLVSGIIDQLRTSGELANTYLIFTSDNGFMLGEHRMTLKSQPYEESVRVPLIVRGPALPKGIEIDAPVGNIDLAPTILDLAGVNPLLEPDGVSLLDVIDDPGAWMDRNLLLEKFNYGDLDAEGAAVRNSRYSYIRQVIDGELFEELYDMDPESETYDPFQLENRADDPELAIDKAVLEARLAQLRNCEGTGPPKACG